MDVHRQPEMPERGIQVARVQPHGMPDFQLAPPGGGAGGSRQVKVGL